MHLGTSVMLNFTFHFRATVCNAYMKKLLLQKNEYTKKAKNYGIKKKNQTVPTGEIDLFSICTERSLTAYILIPTREKALS